MAADLDTPADFSRSIACGAYLASGWRKLGSAALPLDPCPSGIQSLVNTNLHNRDFLPSYVLKIQLTVSTDDLRCGFSASAMHGLHNDPRNFRRKDKYPSRTLFHYTQPCSLSWELVRCLTQSQSFERERRGPLFS
jgi:hypothetical protein